MDVAGMEQGGEAATKKQKIPSSTARKQIKFLRFLTPIFLLGLVNLYAHNKCVQGYIKQISTKGLVAQNILHQNETTSGSSTQKFSPGQHAAAENFYAHHLKHMGALINSSSILVWKFSWTFLFGEFQEGEIVDLSKDNVRDEATLTKFAQSNATYYKIEGTGKSMDLCDFIYLLKRYRETYKGTPKPHVLFARLNMDIGALTRRHTYEQYARKRPMVCHLKEIMEYIHHPETLAIVTSQDQDSDYGPKVISIPIGIKAAPQFRDIVLKLLKQARNNETRQLLAAQRTQLLMLNSKLWFGREKHIPVVIKNFNRSGIELKNTYNYPDRPDEKDKLSLYFEELRKSKFILSPKGYGVDCYRLWDALYMGTIPVMEHFGRLHNDGFFQRTLEHLPVVFVDSYVNLTAEFLEEEYERIVTDWSSMKYEKLTRQYWIHYIRSIVAEYEEQR